MKLHIFLVCLTSVLCVEYVAGDYCYTNVIGACSAVGGEIQNCNSKYGAFKGEDFMTSVQSYAKSHVLKSFQYLLMSSHFGNFEKNRAGFEKLYRELSDEAWEKSIDLVKYIGKRGGFMSFRPSKDEVNDNKHFDYEMYELGSMAKALDMQKNLAEDANYLHAEVTRRKEHDPEVASFLENNFVHQHSSTIRKLSGFTNDLKHLIENQPDSSLSLYLFDEYLKSVV